MAEPGGTWWAHCESEVCFESALPDGPHRSCLVNDVGGRWGPGNYLIGLGMSSHQNRLVVRLMTILAPDL
jgi:hypothetical protein